MARDVTIEMVQLEEIHDLEWPTDPALVASFRKTLLQGEHFSPIRLYRLWQPAATWRYEILDGFHRFEASKAEHLNSLRCQIEEHEERNARYKRIRACIGKPAEITIQRAQRELKGAFINRGPQADETFARCGYDSEGCPSPQWNSRVQKAEPPWGDQRVCNWG